MEKSIPLPDLAEGEVNAGLIFNDDGTPSHWAILLPQKPEKKLNHTDAIAFGTTVEGELPTRQELFLLAANCKKHFEPDWYWSNEKHASASDYAWYQTFSDGYQGCITTTNELRARLVRRFVI